MKKVFSPSIICFAAYCILNLISMSDTYAGHEIVSVRKSGEELTPGMEFSVIDSKYDTMVTHSDWGDQFTNFKIINRFILSIDKASKRFQPVDYTVKVKFMVTTFLYNAATHVFDSVEKAHALEISYKSGSNYNDKTLLQFEGGNRVKIKILSIDPEPASAIMNLNMVAEIDVERYYALDVNAASAIAKLNHSDSHVASAGELEILWDPIPGAEEYDLEWTYVNNSDGSGGTLPDNEVVIDGDIFKYNSTRVTISGTSYRIPLIYEPGYILYRLRAVGRSKESNFKDKFFSQWSYNNGCSNVGCLSNKYYFPGHQSDMNWQFSANYAEEGKRKVAVSYFDGSLRNRQVVSKLNTENKAIVGETVYDYQGRGAIQVLPVPVNDSIIKYYKNFNVNKDDVAYSKLDFDRDTNPTGSDCVVKASGMDSISGASNYYSSLNPDKEGHQAYLPKAFSYPFTQTLYTRDNTGRIRAQTGVGPYHQLGTGHETKYYYGSPQQEELDRLFGSEVGDAVRYKKNMVKDANGQISVSYLDPQGRVIATALAGVKPDNLDPLEDYKVKSFTVDLFNKTKPTDRTGSLNLPGLDKRSLIYNKQILVSSPGPRSFTYEVTPPAMSLGCNIGSVSGTFCSGSVLDLSISLTNECGYNLLDDVTNKTIGSFNLTCANPSSFNKTWHNIPLEPGAYTLTKMLSVNQEALNKYTDEYFKTNDCILKLSDFVAEEMAQIDTFACAMTCDECRRRIGVYEWNTNPYNIDYNPKCDPCYTQSEYNGLIAGCNEYCEDKSINCSSAYDAMVADVSPMGQYGEFMIQSVNSDNAVIDNNGDVSPPVEGGASLIDASKFELSVFNENNRLPVKHGVYISQANFKPCWRFPYAVDSLNKEHLVYMDSKGDTSFIQITFQRVEGNANVFLPPILQGKEIIGPDSTFKVLPKDLADVKDFIANWQETWAQSLVRYHPEYGYYDFCIKQSESNDFDDKWLSATTLQDAIDRGFLNRDTYLPDPLGESPVNALDPYFRDSRSNPFFSSEEFVRMKYLMHHYAENHSLSIWQMVNMTINCPYAGTDGGCTFGYCFDTKIDSDKEWELFKGFYLSLKQKFQKEKSNRYAIGTECYNGCFGVDKFNPFEYGFFGTPFSFRTDFRRPQFFRFFNSQFFNWEQPCNYWNSGLYKDKTKRFSMYDGGKSAVGVTKNVCYNALDSVDAPLVEVDCPVEAAELIKYYEDETDRKVYEECGQCPSARDLEVLLNAIVKRKELTQTFLLSCYPQSNYPEFITDLSTLIPGTGSVQWQVTSHSSKRLDIRFLRNGDGGTMTLALPATTSHTFDDISNICCLNYIRSGVLLPTFSGYNFTCKAEVIIPAHGDVSETTEEIVLEGVSSCINVGECNLPPRCTVSSEG